MNTNTTTPGAGDAPIRVGSSSSFSRPAAMIGGATALIAITAIATTLVVKPSSPAGDPGADARAATMAAQSLLSSPSKSATTSSAKAAGEVADEKPEPKAAAPRTPTPAPERKAAPEQRVASNNTCANCGVVEAVAPVKKKGEASGIGAVGGAVVGGLLGNTMGKGDGRKAMTVIGAVGGGVAGNEIEKNHKATTVYEVRVRMQDGTLRTITQSTAPAVGQKVTVEGSQLKARA